MSVVPLLSAFSATFLILYSAMLLTASAKHNDVSGFIFAAMTYIVAFITLYFALSEMTKTYFS